MSLRGIIDKISGLKNNSLFFRSLLAGILLLVIHAQSWATHLRAGEITVERVDCQELSFVITITVYTDIGPQVTAKFGDGTLDFGDGTNIQIPREENPQDLGQDVGLNVFQTIHTYQGNGIYVISYTEPNRNEGVLNMSNSVNTPFHLETQIFIDPFLGCNDTPVLLVPPVDRGCVGKAFYHNPGAFDREGDSLSYEFVIPKQAKGVNVLDYSFPNDPKFGGATEGGSGPATLSINPLTGEIIWNSPGKAGEYNLAFIVTEWRIVEGVAFKLGHVTRDMQIIIEDCDNQTPDLEVPEDVCVVAGDVVQGLAIGTDPDGDQVKLEAFGGPFEVTPKAIVFPSPPVFVDSPGSLLFQWQTDCSHVRVQPYQVEFKVTDKSDTGPSLVKFKTWNITVIGPPPVLQSANLNLSGGREIDLTWDPYICNNAISMQIWRRVDSFDFTPSECETGMPPYTGYTLLTTLPIDQTTYVDKSLDVGAAYCYRLVAVFSLPGGGESVVSNEVCAQPIEADAPVITHVTVDNTSDTDGQITVSWRSPFDINPAQFPGPYRYDVYRAEGLSGDSGLTLVASTGDTTLIDKNLNTRDFPYNYRIYLFDAADKPVDTSAVASSVRLTPEPLFKEIQINWNAQVPWSNQVQDYPYHYIYRDNIDPNDPTAIQLIDSVNVLQNGFTYLDDGYGGVPLEETKEYCYYVEALGSYGNPFIEVPQRNFSQIICTQPSDTIPPCAPVLEIESLDCATFLTNAPCGFNTFSNNISWTIAPDCGQDIESYNIYYSRTGKEGSFELIDNVNAMAYEHINIPSFAGCYMVTAIDRSGNESEYSNTVCNDNCPNYVLPNIFTPNGDTYNDVFAAFNPSNIVNENGGGGSTIDLSKCPRFVRSVNLTIINRWGKEVFHSTAAGDNSLYLSWNGKLQDGSDAPAGMYYYIAEVTFDLLDTDNSVKVYKGWVQLLR